MSLHNELHNEPEPTNAELRERVCKAYLRGICTEEEWSKRLTELGVTERAEQDSLLMEVSKSTKR